MPIDGDDDAGQNWTNGICIEWLEELSDTREDIYTLADGNPLSESP